MERYSVFVTFLGLLQFLLVQDGFCNMGQVGLPEFMEPIKNMTTHEGSNVEFSCYVKHLENFRIMWLKKEGEKEVFVAINLLKIIKNPRITISLLQTSDDITQSNVYIYNVEKEDTGAYECAVNTNPMISQTGTLEVIVSPETVSVPSVPVKNYPDKPTTTIELQEGTTLSNEIDNLMHTNMTDNLGSGNGTVCSDMNKFWEDATDNIKEFIKNVMKSVVDFTCSFLT